MRAPALVVAETLAVSGRGERTRASGPLDCVVMRPCVGANVADPEHHGTRRRREAPCLRLHRIRRTGSDGGELDGLCGPPVGRLPRRASLARTSSHDFAARGLRACARRRLASSLRWASVTGMASGVAVRLSQISSSSCKRAAAPSERTSLSTVLMDAFSAPPSPAASATSVRIHSRSAGARVGGDHGDLHARQRRASVGIVQLLEAPRDISSPSVSPA